MAKQKPTLAPGVCVVFTDAGNVEHARIIISEPCPVDGSFRTAARWAAQSWIPALMLRPGTMTDEITHGEEWDWLRRFYTNQ